MEVEQFRIRLSAPNQVEVEAEHGKNKGPTGPKRRGGCLCSFITGYANDLLDLYSYGGGTDDHKYPGR